MEVEAVVLPPLQNHGSFGRLLHLQAPSAQCHLRFGEKTGPYTSGSSYTESHKGYRLSYESPGLPANNS